MPHSPQSIRPACRSEAVASAATLGVLLLLPGVICFLRSPVDDPDVWWHLKTGQWILAHGTWPTADPFSHYGAGNPWSAYSWLAEVVLWGLYQGLGLRGLVLFTAILSVAIIAAFARLARRLQGDTLRGVVLTLTAVFGLTFLLTPRPWLLSMLFFVIELDLLLSAGRTGNRRLLLWLVPLFCLWANVHIQFILGLAVLGVAVAESLLVRVVRIPIADGESRAMRPGWMVLVLVLCVAATLVNPYHYHLYEVAVKLLGQGGLWGVIHELTAMPFRSYAHWTVLGVALAAAFALGWQRRIRLLLPLLLGLAVYLGFRSQRDAWVVLIVGLAALAWVGPRPATGRRAETAALHWGVALAVSLLLAGGVLLLNEAPLAEKVAQRYPLSTLR